MVNHGLAAKLTETDLLLLRSLGRLFSYKKNHFFTVSKTFLQLCLKEILLTRRFLTDVMHVQLENTKHNLY